MTGFSCGQLINGDGFTLYTTKHALYQRLKMILINIIRPFGSLACLSCVLVFFRGVSAGSPASIWGYNFA
jgi:hypothetical protein